MSYGFLIRQTPAGVRFQRLTSGDDQRLVSFHSDVTGAALLLGRFHYRLDRLRELGLEEDAGNLSDAALALTIFTHQGTHGLERLEGEFSLVLWDQRAQQLIGLRDPLGAYPLFWSQRGEELALGTSLAQLSSQHARPELDANFIGRFLMLPSQVQELPTRRTIYQNIQRVEAGTILTASRQQVQVRRYWNWEDRVQDHGSTNLERQGEQFEGLLRSAVRERLQGRVASHLSGGMDSTAVTLLANEETSSPIQTISLVYRQAELRGETAYIDAVLQQHPTLRNHRIAADGFQDFDAFRTPPRHEEPCAGLWRMGMDEATVAAAVECGANSLLTGLGADETLVPSPLGIADRLRRGNVWGAWQEATRWAAATNCSPWLFLRNAGEFARPAALMGGFQAWWQGGYQSWRRQNDWTIAPWISRSFSKQQGLQAISADNARNMLRRGKNTALSVALSAIAARTGDVDSWSLALPRGMAISHPFLDTRVLGFGLGLQLLPPDPTQQKPVLAIAMKNILPAAIRQRRAKGDFSSVYFRGLAANLPLLQRLIDTSPLAGKVFDASILRNCLQQAALGAAAGIQALHRLNLTLCLLRWQAADSQRQLPAAKMPMVYSNLSSDLCAA